MKQFDFDVLDWIQLMAEGADGAAAETGDNSQVTAGEEAEQEAPPDMEAEFDALVKGDGKFREIYGRRMQKAALERTKGMKAQVDRLNSFGSAFEVLGARYGMAADDPRLAQAIAQDAGLLDEVAMRNGRDAKTEMELAAAKAQTQQANALIQRMMADQEMQRWQAEAEEIQAEFPDFNLETEMQNPEFKNLLRNNVTMKGAYMALHHDDVIQHTVQKTRKQVTDSVAAGAHRPRENGMGSKAGAAITKDPMQMSRAEFKKWEEAVSRGERVSFSK